MVSFNIKILKKSSKIDLETSQEVKKGTAARVLAEKMRHLLHCLCLDPHKIFRPPLEKLAWCFDTCVHPFYVFVVSFSLPLKNTHLAVHTRRTKVEQQKQPYE